MCPHPPRWCEDGAAPGLPCLNLFDLMAMGLATTFLLFNKMSTLEADATYVYGTTDIPINIGFQLFIFGALLGSVDYIGGIALSYNS